MTIKKLTSTILASVLLSGCASNAGKSPDTAMNITEHGLYWQANNRYSIAKNAYSLAGVDVSITEADVVPGSTDEDTLSKYLVNGTFGYVTGGMKGLSIMTLGSMYSRDDAEYMMLPQFVVFVANPSSKPINDHVLVKDGARYAVDFLSSDAKSLGFNPEKQINAVNNCVISESIINKWNECNLTDKPGKDTAYGKKLFSYQAIRPAKGTEIREMNLPKGEYAVIRYVLFPTSGTYSSKDFKGFLIRPYSKKVIPSAQSISINGFEYYLFSGEMGKKGFPAKKQASQQ